MKYVAIDIGNVICDMHFDNFLLTLSKYLKVDKQDAFDILSKMQRAQDLGLTTVEEELAYTHRLNHKKISIMVDKWNETMTTNKTVADNILDLMSKDVKVALLSNMGREHAAVIRSILSPQLYDNCISFLSCDVGARKPTFLYYKTFLEMYPEFNGCVYIDDRKENIDASIPFGFEACLFGLDTFKTSEEMLEIFQCIKTLVLK
jgi:FMN phosphatase YigB (HAD superfamily)